jgi:hypothetical protein
LSAAADGVFFIRGGYACEFIIPLIGMLTQYQTRWKIPERLKLSGLRKKETKTRKSHGRKTYEWDPGGGNYEKRGDIVFSGGTSIDISGSRFACTG